MYKKLLILMVTAVVLASGSNCSHVFAYHFPMDMVSGKTVVVNFHPHCDSTDASRTINCCYTAHSSEKATLSSIQPQKILKNYPIIPHSIACSLDSIEKRPKQNFRNPVQLYGSPPHLTGVIVKKE